MAEATISDELAFEELPNETKLLVRRLFKTNEAAMDLEEEVGAREHSNGKDEGLIEGKEEVAKKALEQLKLIRADFEDRIKDLIIDLEEYLQ